MYSLPTPRTLVPSCCPCSHHVRDRQLDVHGLRDERELHVVALQGLPDAPDDGQQRAQERVLGQHGVHPRASDVVRQGLPGEPEKHDHDVRHHGLHCVEPQEVREPLVADDEREEHEEPDERGHGRDAVQPRGPRGDHVQWQEHAPLVVEVVAQLLRVDPGDEVHASRDHSPKDVWLVQSLLRVFPSSTPTSLLLLPWEGEARVLRAPAAPAAPGGPLALGSARNLAPRGLSSGDPDLAAVAVAAWRRPPPSVPPCRPKGEPAEREPTLACHRPPHPEASSRLRRIHRVLPLRPLYFQARRAALFPA
mmetsp:Transcript_8694/g.26187  ORF Transcript_8694/g.26187 Transcript_8694/m.26187 type:complete len:307 (+) Transcript_8694:869-1789(+)